MSSRELEYAINEIVSKIRCPECGDTFSLSGKPVKDEPVINKPVDFERPKENKACRDFKEALNDKIDRVRAKSLSLSEFQMWAQRYSQV